MIEFAGRRRPTVLFGRQRRHIVALRIGDAVRIVYPPVENRSTGRRCAAHGQTLVENDVPAGWHVVDRERGRIEVGGFLHGLGELDQVAAVAGLQLPAVEEEPLVGARRRVPPGRFEIAQRGAAEHVADELESGAVPGEQHGTAGQLALNLRDDVDPAGAQFEFCLRHAV